MKKGFSSTKKTYSPKPAKEEELNRAFTDADYKKLRRMLTKTTINQIPWLSLRSLCIIGRENHLCNASLNEADFKFGMYIDRHNEWLLLIHPEESQIQKYINFSRKRLNTLRLYHTSLQSLDLSSVKTLDQFVALGNAGLSDIQGLEHLSLLTNLTLKGCGFHHLPRLDNLTQLTTLNLAGCNNLTTLPPLDRLTQLNTLTLSENSENMIFKIFRSEPQPSMSGGMTSTMFHFLRTLNTYRSSQDSSFQIRKHNSDIRVSIQDTLAKLSGLSFYGCRSLTQLPSLDHLKQLTSLDLSGCSSLTQLPSLAQLAKLTRLNISGCSSLTQLPSLAQLAKLTRLNISGCSSLTQLPSLDNLTQLPELNLSGCSSLTLLPSLDHLTKLTKLDLSDCNSLTQLPSLDNQRQLTELNLSGCSGIRMLPDGIRNMHALSILNLNNTVLMDLPDWLPDIAWGFARKTYNKETGYINYQYTYSRSESSTMRYVQTEKEVGAVVYLDDAIVETIPDMSIFNQPYKMVAEWFMNRQRGSMRTLNEIKVVFLGDGEAGKSHTIARLMNDGGEPDYAVFDGQSTPGIVIRNREYDLGDRKITVHYWDFGGQEIMHSMHRIFLTGRTMYVILLNARDDTQSDRAKYWLHNVKSFAPNAPVLLVLNKIDQNPNASVDEKDLRGRYDKLTQVVRLSAKDFSREEFNTCFTNVLLEEIRKTGFLDAQWPNSWTRVKERLEKMQSHYIMGDAYEDICLECQVNENQENLLHWFNDLGVSFCCRDNGDYALKDYVILRPDWITNALYIILFNSLAGARNGLIPHSSIFDILGTAHKNPAIRCTLPNARYNSGDIQYVLGIMRKFNLSFTDGHENEFIPMLCQQNSMVDVQYYHKDAEILEFNMEFDYLPNNLLHRLMVERYNELDMTAVWRTGARFHFKELGYSAVVVIDGETLRFFIRHENDMHRPNTYLTMLKANVDRIVENMGLKLPTCQLVYKLDGKREEFDFGLLKEMLDARVPGIYSRIQRKLIPIEDILNQSAPDGLEDETKLLDAIRKSCLNIQAEPDYYLKDGESGWGMEDKRNRRIRDDLQMLGYDVKDQTQRGLSGTGRGIGELDMLLYNDRKEPWTIIEALRVSSGTKTDWNRHLDKLVANYNYFGAPCLYLLTYVDSDATNFERIWDGYQRHIPRNDPGKFTYCANSLVVLNAADGPRYIKTAKCQYECGGQMTTAYHIFVLVPRQGETLS